MRPRVTFVLQLVGFSVACLFSVSCGTGTPQIRRADIQVLGTTRLSPNVDEHLTFASALPNGGFLASGSVGGGAAFVYKVSSSGGVLWRTPLPEGTRAFSGGITATGQYWLGGSVADPNVDAVQMVSIDGALTDGHVLARAAADRRPLICAVEHERTYFQIGAADVDEYQHIPVSSISVRNAEGARLWERLTPSDHERRIAPIPQQLLSCAGIFLTGDDRVLAAQQILVWPETHSADDIQQVWISGTRQRPATLVLAFDLGGREIARRRDDDTQGGLLVPGLQGAVLIETSHLKPGLTRSAQGDERVHIHWLNSGLQDIASPLVIEEGPLDAIDAAYMTAQGGLLLAGCSGTTARMFVRYVSKDLSVSSKKELTQLGNCGGKYWIAPSLQPDEFLLLSEAAPNLGSLLTVVRIAE